MHSRQVLFAARRAARIYPAFYPPRSLPIPFARHNSSSPSNTPASAPLPGEWNLFSDAANEGASILDNFRRIVKFLLITSVAGTTLAAAAWEGAHIWVEYKGMREGKSGEDEWGWARELERWSGVEGGGTDPALGLWARHAVRSAWTSLHWGTGFTTQAVHSSSSSRSGIGAGVEGVPFELEFAHDAISKALAVAQSPSVQPKLHPLTTSYLLLRHSAVLETMGVRSALIEAREALERAWATGRGVWDNGTAARVAWRLGEINGRLGDGEEAEEWWTRSIDLSNEKESLMAGALPAEPFDQRTLASALVSLSAFYATRGDLSRAREVQERALELLAPFEAKLASTSAAPQHLHVMYLAHRAALLRAHLAEVAYAQDPKTAAQQPISLLASAATTSERVALSLAGLPHVHPDAPGSGLAPPPAGERSLAPTFEAGVVAGPARALFRDARRSAGRAWNLMGVLYEQSNRTSGTEKGWLAWGGKGKGKGKETDGLAQALECYERALGWVGAQGDGAVDEAGEGVLEEEWRSMWADYVRVREKVKEGRMLEETGR